MAVDTFGYLLTLHVTAADEQGRTRVAQLAQEIQAVAGESVELVFVDQGHTGEKPAQDAAQHGIKLEVVKLSEGRKGFVLLSRRWVVKRSFASATRFRRLTRDYKCLPESLAGLHYLVFIVLMLKQFVELMTYSAQHALAWVLCSWQRNREKAPKTKTERATIANTAYQTGSPTLGASRSRLAGGAGET